jgi:hypothetical protein
MRSHFVVVQAPGFDRSARVVQGQKPTGVEALVPQPSVEGFDVPVLHGATRTNEVEADSTLAGPSIEVMVRELRAVVARDTQRFTP